MTSDPRFIHLRVHTEYSLLEGAVRLKGLPELCNAAGMPAVAVTDTNNMFAALEFSVTAQGAGVQPIMGCQADLAYVPPAPGARMTPPAPVVLLAQDERGYGNLMKLNSCLYLRGDGQVAHVTPDELAAHAEGVICLTGGPDGPVGRLLRGGQRGAAEALMQRLAAAFGDRLYVELQRHPGEGGAPEAERLTERGHVEMAYAMDLPLVATNDVYFPEGAMYEAHDALLCVADGAYVDQNAPRRRLTPQHYFKSRTRWPRSSPICPRRWRTPSRSPGAAPSGPRRATRSCRVSPMTRWRSCAARRARGSGRGSPSSPRRAGRGLRGAARIRARHHRGHGLSRLFPDRRRFHQMGQGA